MELETAQAIEAAVASFVFIAVVYRLGRQEKLSFRYTVGWMALGTVGLLGGLLAPLASPLAEQLRLAPSGLLAIIAIALLLVLCVQLSISISGTQSRVQRLAEEAALLRLELENSRDSGHEPS